MEDAHLALLQVNKEATKADGGQGGGEGGREEQDGGGGETEAQKDAKIRLFGVFDGHGGMFGVCRILAVLWRGWRV